MNSKEKLEAIDTACWLMKKQVLYDLLAQCTEKQQNFFKTLYNKGVPEDKIEQAIQQCEATIKKNNKAL